MSETSKFFLLISIGVLGWIFYNFYAIASCNLNNCHTQRLDELAQAYKYVAILGGLWGCAHVVSSNRRKLQKVILFAVVLLIPAASIASFSYIENNFGGFYAE